MTFGRMLAVAGHGSVTVGGSNRSAWSTSYGRSELQRGGPI